MTDAVERPWGPVVLRLLPATPAEASWFADHYALSANAPWPRRETLPLRTTVDADAVLDLSRHPAGAAAQRIRDEHYHVLDDGTCWVRAADRPADASVAALPPHAIRRTGHGWDVVTDGSPSGDRLSEILARMLLLDALTRAGGTVLHASSAVVGGRATVFVGAGEAGKTTLALHATRAGGEFVSGDQTVLLPGAERLVVGAGLMPRLRWGTLRGLGLADTVLGATLRRHEGARRPLSRIEPRPAKVAMTQAELTTVLGVRTTDAGVLDRLVFVERRPGTDLLVAPLDPREAVAELAEQVLRPLAGWRPPGGEATCAEPLTRIAAETPAFRVRWDPAVHPAVTVLDRLATAAVGSR
ncbi:hypothetical protein [Micromonospora sp. NPDC023644]|uniref:hypothetical protein n=1 Tax=Micromonospora sp. NPDC023644 TaxID=3154321 RepID=UPI00340DD2EE